MRRINKKARRINLDLMVDWATSLALLIGVVLILAVVIPVGGTMLTLVVAFEWCRDQVNRLRGKKCLS